MQVCIFTTERLLNAAIMKKNKFTMSSGLIYQTILYNANMMRTFITPWPMDRFGYILIIRLTGFMKMDTFQFWSRKTVLPVLFSQY